VNGALIRYLSVNFSEKSAAYLPNSLMHILSSVSLNITVYLRLISEFHIFLNRWSRNCKLSVQGTSYHHTFRRKGWYT